MARVTTWMSVSLMATAATVATVGFIGAAGLNEAPTVGECVEDWNDRAGEGDQQAVAEQNYRSAEVHGWFAKESYPGCGIGFIAPEGERFLSCTRTFEAADPRLTDWSCEWRTPVVGDDGPVIGDGGRSTVEVVSGWQLALG